MDPEVTARRPLKYFAYSLIGGTEKTQFEVLNRLKELGFCVNEYKFLANNVGEMLEFYDRIYSNRHNLGYDIDGVVYKVNDLKLHDRLGNTNKAPRGSTAHKLPAAQGKTKIKKISVQVGRTGVLTPIAELVPINIGGVLITRANLYNKDEIKRKDIREGDIVVVERAGDVISRIVEVDKKSRSRNTPKFIFPDTCPECGVRSDVAVFVMVKFHLPQTSGIMYVSHFREWQPLRCKHEAKAGNVKPYGKSPQTELDMITRETYVRIVVTGNMRKEVEYA